MKTLIAVPCMDQVATPFCQSLVTLNKVGECTISFNVGSLVSESREHLAARALNCGADYVLWFDSDMIFAPDTMEKLVKHMEDGYDIVSGLYFRRRSPFTPVLFKRLFIQGEACLQEDYNDYPEDGLFEVEGIGFGCVMMKTEVLLSVFARYKNCFTMMGRNGEDVSFSMRARNCGYKIWCDPSIKCGHIAYSMVNEGFYKNYKLHSKGQ
ncbi:MAG: glycosyltransferase [Firmicutes bacterium]|nr:glycosyltransferase [Bacillota bacterium]